MITRSEGGDSRTHHCERPLVAAVEKLSKPRPHLPIDYALNHGHYIRGEPKK
jgi:hypothetical protein